jgi:MFS family permease
LPSLSIPRPSANWIAFLYLALWAYLLYGLGNATPYLRTDLRLTDFEAGLHASALAIGVLASGVSADAIARRVGPGRLLDLAVLALTAAVALIALAPALPVSLAGAFLMGLGGGTLGTQVNVELGRADAVESRKLMSQANALSMVTAAAAPLAMGLAASILQAWRLGLILPIFGLVALTVIRPRRAHERVTTRGPRVALPFRYWFVWTFLVIAVSIEFSIVFWSSTIVSRKTGLSPGDATLLASCFVAGMFAGRAALGRGFGAGRAARGLLAAGLVVVLAGTGLVWAAPTPILAGIGLFVAGLGLAGMWPIGVAVALQDSPKASYEAAARATLASGVAVLVAPSLLGLLSDHVGVVSAWPIILLMAAAGLAVLAITPRADTPAVAVEA